MQPNADFSSDQADLLRRFLVSPERPEGTMSYPVLGGFLFAVCSAPELIHPSEWMPLIFNEQDAGYRDLGWQRRLHCCQHGAHNLGRYALANTIQ